MPSNLILYPLDFVVSSNDDNQIKSITDLLQSLQIKERDNSQNLAHIRRTAGQNEIICLQQDDKVAFALLPLNKVGKTKIGGVPVLGTIAYLGGTGHGAGSAVFSGEIHSFRFVNEVFALTNASVAVPTGYKGTTCNVESGKFCGGSRVGGFTNGISKIKYATESTSKVAATLSQPLACIIGGLGTAAKGILVGGSVAENTLMSRHAHIYNHVTDTVALQQNFLPQAKFSSHDGLSSQYAGYVWGGYTERHGGSILTAVPTVDEIIYATNTFAAQKLSLTVSHLQALHAAFGNAIAGYLTNGANLRNVANPIGVAWLNKLITSFTYSGQTESLIAAQLSQGYTCTDGTGYNLAGFVVGGDNNPSGVWPGTINTTKLKYSSLTLSTVGSTLKKPCADQGTVSDYNPSWSEV